MLIVCRHCFEMRYKIKWKLARLFDWKIWVKIHYGSKTMNCLELILVQKWMDSFVVPFLAFNMLKVVLWQPIKLIILPFCFVLLCLRASKDQMMKSWPPPPPPSKLPQEGSLEACLEMSLLFHHLYLCFAFL